MVEKDDWRRMAQERYLLGVRLHAQKYQKYREGWDHDHCAFCFQKFMEVPGEQIETEGYTTDDCYYWICKTCFLDFKDEFKWAIEE